MDSAEISDCVSRGLGVPTQDTELPATVHTTRPRASVDVYRQAQASWSDKHFGALEAVSNGPYQAELSRPREGEHSAFGDENARRGKQRPQRDRLSQGYLEEIGVSER